MHKSTLSRLIIAFIAAVVVATVWGSVVQTQFNLNALAGIGVDVTSAVRVRTTVGDIFSGFSPTYGGYVVLPSLLFAFAAAWFISNKKPGYPMLWLAAAGLFGILVGNPVVNFLSPLALLVGATRDFLCLLLMALGGAAAGLVFATIARHDRRAMHLTPGYNQKT